MTNRMVALSLREKNATFYYFETTMSRHHDRRSYQDFGGFILPEGQCRRAAFAHLQ
jgi:hypothetical protein